MGYDAAPKDGPPRRPRNTHYVGTNNVIYPAQTGLPGYEDDNPADFRPATNAEIEQYNKGNDVVSFGGSAGVVDLSAAAPTRTPTKLTLADDDEPAAPVAPAPAIAAVDPSLPPQLPVGAIGGAPIAPAFNIAEQQ
jgi:hypothetical protein